MSDEAVIALAAVVVSGIVGIATLAFNFWNASSERSQRLTERRDDQHEWYQRTLFDRRLEALQRVDRWLDVAWDVYYSPTGTTSTFPVNEVVEWYAENQVYIHGEMPEQSVVGRFLYSLESYGQGAIDMPPQDQLWVARNFIRSQANDVLLRRGRIDA
jgi:hypothetical protein